MNSSCLTLLKIDEIFDSFTRCPERLWGLLFRDIQKASGCGSQQLPPVGSTWAAVGPDGLKRVLPSSTFLWFIFFFSCTSLIFNQHLHNLDQIWNLFCMLLDCLWWNKLHHPSIGCPVWKPYRCWWQRWTCRRFSVAWDALPGKQEW